MLYLNCLQICAKIPCPHWHQIAFIEAIAFLFARQKSPFVDFYSTNGLYR